MGLVGSEGKADVRVAAAEQWNSSKFHVRKGCGIRICATQVYPGLKAVSSAEHGKGRTDDWMTRGVAT